ncbi:hypothetical protein BDR05DRAFT_971693 [Suillus weaverae]|nr:hypothetical protein BDR05DRAFT_971693 [Suillus weaverae]
MNDFCRQQQPQPSTPDPFPVLQVPSHTDTHAQSHPRTRGKDRSGKTPTNRPVLTVQTSATKKTSKAGHHASGSVKSPLSYAPLSSARKHSAAVTMKHTATATVPASATVTSLNPLLTARGAPGGGKATLLTTTLHFWNCQSM